MGGTMCSEKDGEVMRGQALEGLVGKEELNYK